MLPYRTEGTMYSEEVLKLFQHWIDKNATTDDLKQWWESKTSVTARKRSSSILEEKDKMEEDSF